MFIYKKELAGLSENYCGDFCAVELSTNYIKRNLAAGTFIS